jgi:hypothetical protein
MLAPVVEPTFVAIEEENLGFIMEINSVDLDQNIVVVIH